jgi:hypothetical protein
VNLLLLFGAEDPEAPVMMTSLSPVVPAGVTQVALVELVMVKLAQGLPPTVMP